MKVKAPISVIVFILGIIYTSSINVYSHSVDEIYLYLKLQNIEENSSYVYKAKYFVSWSQVLHLIEEVIAPKKIEDLKPGSKLVEYLNYVVNKYKSALKIELLRSIVFSNNGALCSQEILDEITINDKYIFEGQGIQFNLKFICKEKLENIMYKNTLFYDEADIQQNIIILQDFKDNEITRGIGNKNIQEVELQVSENQYTKTKSTTPEIDQMLKPSFLFRIKLFIFNLFRKNN